MPLVVTDLGNHRKLHDGTSALLLITSDPPVAILSVYAD